LQDELIRKAATMDPGLERFGTLREAEEIFITQDQAVVPVVTFSLINVIDLAKWGDWHLLFMLY
jgi:oligopeptide transport system substrate-binding protein